MRLSSQQISAIRAEAARRFGASARVWLFGSRADDRQAGGDIDLYVEAEDCDPATMFDAKLLFLVDFKLQFGEQKIDLVLGRANSPATATIAQIAKQTGVRLL